MTVKRRFKTLMLRKKKRQSEREADAAQKDNPPQIDESDTNGASRDDPSYSEKGGGLNKGQQPQVGESSAGQIDLNSHPNREDMPADTTGLGMASHLETTNHEVRDYMNQNGLRSFNSDLQASQHPSLLTQSTGGQRYFPDEGCFASIVWKRERKDEVYNNANQSQNNLS